MTPVWIAVAVLAAFGFAVVICIVFAVAWYAIMQMRAIQASAQRIVDSVAEVTGDGSVTRLSRAVTSLAAELPGAVETLKAFNQTMTDVKKLMFTGEESRGKAAPLRVPPDTGSAFYGYSEEDAAAIERSSKIQAEKLDLSAAELSVMRTENQRMPDKSSLPPDPDEIKTA